MTVLSLISATATRHAFVLFSRTCIDKTTCAFPENIRDMNLADGGQRGSIGGVSKFQRPDVPCLFLLAADWENAEERSRVANLDGQLSKFPTAFELKSRKSR